MVNKKLKLNDEHQKKRVDELTATIEKQNLIIQKLKINWKTYKEKSGKAVQPVEGSL